MNAIGRRVWHDCPVPGPQYCPSPRELDDLELLLSGALAPQTTFDDSHAGAVTLTLPPELEDAPEVELVDPEGLPLAAYSIVEGRATSVSGPRTPPPSPPRPTAPSGACSSPRRRFTSSTPGR